MIIDLRTILESPQNLEFILEADWWVNEEKDVQILGLEGPLRVQITISRVGSKYVVNGHLLGLMRLRCARCLEPYVYNLKTDFSLYLISPPSDTSGEIELGEGDMSVDFTTGDDEINLYDIVREQVYLSLPIKFLCHEDCSGLCPVCGADLNKVVCDCQQKTGHPGFSKLKNLILKGV